MPSLGGVGQTESGDGAQERRGHTHRRWRAEILLGIQDFLAHHIVGQPVDDDDAGRVDGRGPHNIV